MGTPLQQRGGDGSGDRGVKGKRKRAGEGQSNGRSGGGEGPYKRSVAAGSEQSAKGRPEKASGRGP